MNQAETYSASGLELAPSRKALYLMSRTRLSIRQAGASLAAFEGKVCRGRFPLNRVSRVLSSRHVDWRGEALVACMRAGVCIIFLDGHGSVYGTCEPPLVRVSPITEALDELVEESDWPNTFDNFMRHLRSHALKAWIEESSNTMLPRGVVAAWNKVYVHRGEVPVPMRFEFRGLVRALISARLHARGIRARYCLVNGKDLDLAEELASLVYGQIAMRAGSMQLQARQGAVAVKLFEAAVDDYTVAIDKAIVALARLLNRRLRWWQ